MKLKKTNKTKQLKTRIILIVILILLLPFAYFLNNRKSFQELPKVAETSSIELDEDSGWYRYTDNTGKFSLSYPTDWELHNWDNRDSNDWNMLDKDGMSWDWYLNNSHERRSYPLLIVDSDINENIIGNPFISFHIVANEELLGENVNIVSVDDIEQMSKLFKLNTDDTKIKCPSVKNGTFSCSPNDDLYLKTNSNIFLIRLTGQTNEEMNDVIDSISFF